MASNPELYWEGRGELRHSIAIMSGFESPGKLGWRMAGSLTMKNLDDIFAALCWKTREG
jgi:hypothetical protein